MTRKDIARSISAELGLTQAEAADIVRKTFDAIVKMLVEERRVELRNFGVFEVKQRKARSARNPRTGEKVFVPEKFAVTFKAGSVVQGRVEKETRTKAASGNVSPKGARPND